MAILTIKGIIGKDYTYESFLKSVARLKNNIDIEIDSVGGSVEQGRLIAKYINEHQDSFNSVSNTGIVASIASHIFVSLPFEKRFFDMAKGVFLPHLPFLPNEALKDVYATAETLETITERLRVIEQEMAEYFSVSTGNEYDIVYGMMSLNKPFSYDQMLDMKIANLKDIQAVAFYKQENQMEKEDVQKIVDESHVGLIDKFLAIFNRRIKFVATILTDATGVKIEFPDVAEGSDPMVGDTAKMEDGTFPNGEVLMPDGMKYEFENGVLKEIVMPETTPADAPAPSAELEAVKAELEAAKTELAKFKAEMVTFKAEIRTEFLAQKPEEKPEEKPEVSAFAAAAQKIKEQIKN